MRTPRPVCMPWEYTVLLLRNSNTSYFLFMSSVRVYMRVCVGDCGGQEGVSLESSARAPTAPKD